MTGESSRQILPSAIGIAARRALEVLHEKRVDPAPLLRRAGLSDVSLARPPSRLSAAAQSRFLELAAEAVGDSAFGLHLAEGLDPRVGGIIYYLSSAAATVGEALGLFVRYARIANQAVRFTVAHSAEGVVAELGLVGLSRHPMRQNSEFILAVVVQALREPSGRRFRAERVAFAHPRNADLKDFERFFGCPVEFGASADELVFAETTLAIPLLTEDRYLLEALRPVCEEAASQRGTAPGSLRAAVENEVQKLLPLGKAQRDTVAKALGLSTRTLSRRLSEEGASYENVVDDLRRSLALQYVREPGVSVSQIAWLLGYENPTSFNHAFRRWTGVSPSSARSAQRLAPGP